MVNVKSVADLKAIPIPLPPAEDQKRINLEVDRRLSLIREIEAQVDTNLKRAERLRQSVLRKVFSGYLMNECFDNSTSVQGNAGTRLPRECA